MEYGRAEYVTEHDPKASNEYFKQSEKEKQRLKVASRIEDRLMCQSMGISIEELNQGRMQQ